MSEDRCPNCGRVHPRSEHKGETIRVDGLNEFNRIFWTRERRRQLKRLRRKWAK